MFTVSNKKKSFKTSIYLTELNLQRFVTLGLCLELDDLLRVWSVYYSLEGGI
jgi:hypothetical protein